MEYTTLGKTGLRVSRMGFGGIPIQKVDAAVTRKLMERLVERGVNYIDTARGYTVSESFLGEALEGGLREKFVLATKSMARTRAEMERDIEISLRNLRTDHIDLYQVHNPSLAELEQVTAPGGALEALLAAKAAGKIGHIGVTAHMAGVFEKALTMDWVETVMFPYNIVETQGEALMQKCREQNVGFICMKPMAGGALEECAALHRAQRKRLRRDSGHVRCARNRPEYRGHRGCVPADRGGAREARRDPPGAGHAVLPPLQLLPALHGGHRHQRHLRAGRLSESLRLGRLGEAALCGHGQEGRGLRRLRRVRKALPVSASDSADARAVQG